MNHETELRLQAFLDGELSPAESKKVAEWLEGNPEAKELRNELEAVHSLLRVNEPQAKVPETREFYWSKIQGEISRAEGRKQGTREVREPNWIFRWAASLAGVALALFMYASWQKQQENVSAAALTHLQEVEAPLPDVSAISFHSQEAAMTVVWVQTGKY